jgi:starch phosphorylase
LTTCYQFEVRPQIPLRLARLEELAGDLYYSWSSQVRGLFLYLDSDLWHACGHNPKLFLRRVAYQKLDAAENDHVFMESYNRALLEYDTYMSEAPPCLDGPCLRAGEDLVAYFCFEFGLHESVPIYSGGLGILAGDHCKAASDLGIPLVGVGLLYRHGYFNQRIDRHGRQIVDFAPTDFSHLPLSPLLGDGGEELRVAVDFPGRKVWLRVWQAMAGRIRLLLLDSDLAENEDEDRSITHSLYGGGAGMRIAQAIVLGIGGVRALRALGMKPTVWHINEGHAAFQILERCRELVASGIAFNAALELVAAATVFTTHTPVPAGHDIFGPELVHYHFSSWFQALGLEQDSFMALGATPLSHGGFNMTSLALQGSRFHNGVSRIHGGVASEMEAHAWPEIPPDENPIGYITNGVHVPTILSSRWQALFDNQFSGQWRNNLLDVEYWSRIDSIPDLTYWSTRQTLKAEMLAYLQRRVTRELRRHEYSEVEIARLTRYLDPANSDTLILGFARRFATYKRATLLFEDLPRLTRLLTDPDRPVLLLFAGKAHPNDVPGQRLIQHIHEISMRHEFQGRILVLEDYNLTLARWLVVGVDVWLNTPEYPLEASGTSGQKAAINGVINLSVLDGWWAEAYDGGNGWGITAGTHYNSPEERNRDECQILLDILEDAVIPIYYERNGHGFSEGWIARSKASMKTVLPRFNAGRMIHDYVVNQYVPASLHGRALAEDAAAPAQALGKWKHQIAAHWHEINLRRIDTPVEQVEAGGTLSILVGVTRGPFAAEDIAVECLLGPCSGTEDFAPEQRFLLSATRVAENGELVYELRLEASMSGLQCYKIRAYPFHPSLAHRFETGRMTWL